MQVSRDGIELITYFEGFRSLPYLDAAGHPTVGVGHLVRPGEDFSGGVTPDQARELLRLDLQDAESAVNRLIYIDLEQHQFDALVSFTFNLGGGALQRSTLRRCVNRGNHQEAADQFLRWVYAGGRKLRGLELRRMAERLMYLG
uniref:Putative glycoside hydrolase n=1 Tax=viral metagenome TaxID=1070528 RepID=A0A6M3XRR4_9ZZZZ